MENEPEINIENTKYELPNQQPRTDPLIHRAPIFKVREDSELDQSHLDAYQIIATARYIRKVSRNWIDDPIYRHCYDRAIQLFREFGNREDEESVLLRHELKDFFYRTVAGNPQGGKNENQ
jgi:hypothetical protein